MDRSAVRYAALVALLAVPALACDRSSRAPSPDSSNVSVTSAPSAIVSGGATSSSSHSEATSECPHDGKWALCSIEKRLRQSGFVVKRLDGDTAHRAGFTIAPTVYTLGQTRLEIFLYRDSVSLARDIAKIDTVTVGPLGSPSQWGEVPPVLIRSVNLAAVILSQNPRQAERVTLALTAGPPQPGSPR
jgi:hypothetical protein